MTGYGGISMCDTRNCVNRLNHGVKSGSVACVGTLVHGANVQLQSCSEDSSKIFGRAS